MIRILLCSVVVMAAVVAASPVYPQKPVVPILQDDRTQNTYGEYSFTYKTGDGIERQESGKQDDGQVAEGSWTYTAPDGSPVAINFVADHGGYQPNGDVLPVAPDLLYTRSGN